MSNLTVADLFFTLENEYLDEAQGIVISERAKISALRGALFDVFNKIADLCPEMAIATVTIPWVPNTIEYALPGDFSSPERLYVEIVGTPPGQITIPILSQTMTGQGYATAYIRNDMIGIFLTQSPSGGTVKLDYIQRVALPMSQRSTLNVPDEWFPLIAFRAAIQLMRMRTQMSAAKMQELSRQYNEELTTLVTLGAKRGRDTHRYIGVD